MAGVKKKAGAVADKLHAKDYVHLHNHTQYSLLDGLTKIPALVDFVKASGMEAVAITDHGTLSGAVEFYKAAKAAGIKPIIGMETYVATRSLADKEPGKDKPNFHLILLAMNGEGYQNLIRLSTIANLEGFYYRPRVDRETLAKYSAGIIVLSGCINGEFGDALRRGDYAGAKRIASWYKKIFGDRYYLEVQDHGHAEHPSRWDEQTKVTEGTLKLADELKIPAVVTCDAHYLKHEDQEAHEILLCVQTASFLTDTNRMSLKDIELHVTPPAEIIKRWGKTNPELITNTKAIADRCNVELQLGKTLIPTFQVPKGESEKSYLDLLTFRGLVKRYSPEAKPAATVDKLKKQLSAQVRKRAEYELGVIDRMGFNGYFLIVADFINWGKDQGIIFGPGRGSGAGSIVAYALKITEIEPLKFNLMFERFLNPDRISMPDFDIDIQDTRRDEVINYCVEKYGKDHVANIVTFGRMAARNAVRDVARVLQVPYAEADRLAKMLPPPNQGRHIPLERSIKDDKDLKVEYATNETAKRVFDLAMQLEGTIRSHGVHAAGVVIAPQDIVNYVPLELAQKGVVATQYSMGPIEELGLLKIDFLGLSNLTIIKNALRIIKKVHGKDIDIDKIPLDDKSTFRLLAKADTTGVFQLESAGMKRYLRELKPTEFSDIIAMVALYRPGPMAEIPSFIKGKNNPESIKYPHPSLEPLLRDTYGVIVVQEQIVGLLQLIAGYTPGEADLVRKAIGKKKRDIMNAEKPRFIEGCLKKGLSAAGAEKLWALIQPFADYSFNKAHAACYALIAYQTAYLKAHYPAEFMAALMTSAYGDTDRLAVEISECQRMGIEVLPPDVNESFADFAVVPGASQIRFGLDAVKNVGSGAVAEVLRARQEKLFDSLEDFLARVSVRLVNRKALESLIKAGALDRFGERTKLLHNIDNLLAYGARLQKQLGSGQTDLFGALGEAITVTPKLTLQEPSVIIDTREQLLWERELLGLYLSEHPLQLFEAILAEQATLIKDVLAGQDGKVAIIGGSVTAVRSIVTKNGQKMAFVKLEDRSQEIEAVLFPKVYAQTAELWQRDRVVLVSGKISARGKDGSSGEVKILVDAGQEITPEQARSYQPSAQKVSPPQASTGPKKVPPPERVYIKLASSEDQQTLLSLKAALDNYQGSTEVVLVLGEASQQIIKLPVGINKDSDGLGLIKELVGADNFKLQ